MLAQVDMPAKVASWSISMKVKRLSQLNLLRDLLKEHSHHRVPLLRRTLM